MKLILAYLLVVTNLHAAVFKINGDKIEFQDSNFMVSDLVKTYASNQQLNLVFDSDYQDSQIISVGPKTMNKDSLELYISAMLSQNGFGMRTLPETRTLSVFNSRDVRYINTSTFKDLSKVPDTYEHVQFMYELKHIESVELARNLRPFIGRYGRIIDHTNSVMIADTGKNVRRVMKIIQELDSPEYLKSAEEVKELNEKNKTVISKKKPLLEILNENNVIFLLLFSLIGAIIGFGVRGYSMKRIEGGW